MAKKILVVLGHPNSKSYCNAIAEAYAKGAAHYSEVKILKIGDLKFDPNLKWGYSKIQKLEPGLKNAQKMISWADHLVFVYPTWWSTMPALLKGFFDRILLPGFAFRFHENGKGWDKLLKGKSAHLFITMMAPGFAYRIFFGAPGIKQMKRGILGFCGVSPIRTTIIGMVEGIGDKKRKKILKRVEELGEKCR